jgi:hypothetical protein
MWSWRLGCLRPEWAASDQLHIIDRVTLGHESVETTQVYLDANLAIKREILEKTRPVNGKLGRYRPGDRLLRYLQSL